ncbi:hypothetical protein ACFL41_02440 [Gemmatimonadota bacterium]
MNIRTVLLTASILLCVACSSRTGHVVEHFERDGTPIVRTTGAPRHAGPLFELEEDLVLGLDEGEPEWQLFGQFVWFTAGPDERLYVATSPDYEIHIVSRTGELLGTFGRRGQGPGEYSFPGANWWINGQLWMDDRQLNRIVQFSPDGEYLGILDYAPHREHFRTFEMITSDRFLGMTIEGAPITTQRYCLLDAELDLIDDFVTLPGQSMIEVMNGVYYPKPFDANGDIRPYPDGRLLVVNPHTSELLVYSPQGDLLFGMEREWEPAPITAEDRTRWRARYENNPDPATQAWVNRVEFESHRYPFSRAFTDDSGRAWIVRGLPLYDDERQVSAYLVDVFDRDGIWLGTQELKWLPSLITGDFMYINTRGNAEEGPRIIRYRLIPM